MHVYLNYAPISANIVDERISTEFFPKNKELGYDVFIEYKDKSTEQFYNLTEVHLYYNTDINAYYNCAFESDIHRTGSTRKDTNIQKMSIVDSEKVHQYINVE